MKNHKGFTIVELLIGMTILSIVAVALTGFIVSSSKSYAASNTEIMVQQESQLAMNQISDVIIDATRSVNYVGYSLDGSTEQVIKDADFTIDVEDKYLVIYNGQVEYDVDENGEIKKDGDGNLIIATNGDGTQKIDEGNGNKNYQIYWDKSEEKLYFTQIDITETEFEESDRVLLADYVKDFSVDLSQVEEKRVVKLTLSYGYNNKTYETSNNITIRNKVLVNSINLAVNKSVELNIRVKEKMVVLEPGEEYRFSTPIVEGRNILDKSVTWSISTESTLSDPGDGNNGHTGLKDVDNGIIHISSAEQANSFKVIVTTNATDSAGNHASDEVTVHVKRAKSISMSKTADSDADNGPLEISPGCTFTISANVEGNRLGVTCSRCGDDVTIDRQVSYSGNPYGNIYVWRLADNDPNDGWNPDEYVELLESKPNSSTWRVKSGIPDDGSFIFVIQSCSLLSSVGNSCGRQYDWPVFGAIELKVVKHKQANITAGGSLHWGASTVISWEDLSYFHYYVVCARIREYGTEGGDKIMMYLSEGTTTRVTPDMFGVEDVSKPWYLSLQVLNPGKEIPPGVGLSTQLNVGAQVNDPTILDMIDDYLNNCDSSGTYVGTKYLHSDKLEATINPPEIYYEYNGEKNLGGELKLKPVSILGGSAWTEFKVDYVRNTRDEVLGYWFANNNIKYSVYKETADGGLQKIYWYNAEGNYYEGDSRPYGGFLQLDEINAAGAKIKLESNNMNRASEAVGKYLLVPTIIYEQNSGADHAGGNFLYYLNYKPNYNNKQCYEDKKSTVYYELISGNLKDLWISSYDNFYKGEIYFPTPSDSAFRDYFTLKNPSVQSVSPYNYFKLKKNNDGNIQGVEFSRMTCRYISTEDAYEIELFYKCTDSLWGSIVEMSAGTFKCSADGTVWNRVWAGTLDEQLNRGNTTVASNGNAKIQIGDNKQVEAYIPLPTDATFTNTWYGNFGFDLNTIKTSEDGQRVEPNGLAIKYRNGNSTADAQVKEATCKYDKDKKTYTLEITYYNGWNWGNDPNMTKYKVTVSWQEGTSAWK